MSFASLFTFLYNHFVGHLGRSRKWVNGTHHHFGSPMIHSLHSNQRNLLKNPNQIQLLPWNPTFQWPLLVILIIFKLFLWFTVYKTHCYLTNIWFCLLPPCLLLTRANHAGLFVTHTMLVSTSWPLHLLFSLLGRLFSEDFCQAAFCHSKLSLNVISSKRPSLTTQLKRAIQSLTITPFCLNSSVGITALIIIVFLVHLLCLFVCFVYYLFHPTRM